MRRTTNPLGESAVCSSTPRTGQNRRPVRPSTSPLETSISAVGSAPESGGAQSTACKKSTQPTAPSLMASLSRSSSGSQPPSGSGWPATLLDLEPGPALAALVLGSNASDRDIDTSIYDGCGSSADTICKAVVATQDAGVFWPATDAKTLCRDRDRGGDEQCQEENKDELSITHSGFSSTAHSFKVSLDLTTGSRIGTQCEFSTSWNNESCVSNLSNSVHTTGAVSLRDRRSSVNSRLSLARLADSSPWIVLARSFRRIAATARAGGGARKGLAAAGCAGGLYATSGRPGGTCRRGRRRGRGLRRS